MDSQTTTSIDPQYINIYGKLRILRYNKTLSTGEKRPAKKTGHHGRNTTFIHTCNR